MKQNSSEFAFEHNTRQTDRQTYLLCFVFIQLNCLFVIKWTWHVSIHTGSKPNKELNLTDIIQFNWSIRDFLLLFIQLSILPLFFLFSSSPSPKVNERKMCFAMIEQKKIGENPRKERETGQYSVKNREKRKRKYVYMNMSFILDIYAHNDWMSVCIYIRSSVRTHLVYIFFFFFDSETQRVNRRSNSFVGSFASCCS